MAEKQVSPVKNKQNVVKGLSRRLWMPTLVGFSTVALAFGGFGYWAATAPIAGAALASGTIGPDNARQKVQHLEGGVISKISVRDGQQVKAGQQLLVLDDTKAKTQLLAQIVLEESLKAREIRLETELAIYEQQKSSGILTFPKVLLDGAKERPSTRKLLDVERSRFKNRMDALASSAEIYRQTIAGYRAEIVGLQVEVDAIQRQLDVLNEEGDLYEGLRKRGLELQSKVLLSQRTKAQSEQQKAERESRIVKLKGEIETTKLKLKDLWAVRLDEVSSELASIAQELLSTSESIRSYRDTLDRTIVTSPVDGTLISLAVNTEGGVLAPGGLVVEIVPSKDALTIEARVEPIDIDVVAVGQEATITLLAYPQRNLPKIYGTVKSVSADSLVDETTGDTYYQAKIEFTQGELDKLGKDVKVVPGMTVQVMIRTASRTFYDYVMSPVFDTADRAFKEQ